MYPPTNEGEEAMRLVTRGNLDGLCCAVLITEAETIDTIELIHPQDITDGLFEVERGDIFANLPYHPKCLTWFDHHSATRTYDKPPTKFTGRFGMTSSSARLVYTYYKVKQPSLERFEDFLNEVDRFDGAALRMDDVTNPSGYILLGFTLDPRSGLGSYKDYFLKLVEIVKQQPIDEVLQLPDVKKRVDRISADRRSFLELMKQHSRVEGNVIVTDLREVDMKAVGNRFLIYTLFPEANVSLRIAWGPDRKFVVATVGHNIFNRTCRVHVGELMAKYGGGGHGGAGATPLAADKVDQLIEQMVKDLQDEPRANP
jgi:hypothetical protein